MRKFLIAICAVVLMMSGCGDEKTPVPEKTLSEVIDVDLTKLSGTMVYSAVFDIVENPLKYRGKTIKIRGTHFVSHDPAKNEYHHACVIWDATACCMQGMEFELADKNYPPNESDITLIGKFDVYTIQKIDNPILRSARLAD